MPDPELAHRLAAILSADAVARIPRVNRRDFLVENLRKAGLRESE